MARKIIMSPLLATILLCLSCMATNLTRRAVQKKYPKGVRGGSIATFAQYPFFITYTIFIHRSLIRETKEGCCCGSMLTPRWMLTAAHCVYIPARALEREHDAQVSFLVLHHRGPNDPPGLRARVVKSIKLYKHFRPDAKEKREPYRGDSAMVEFEEPFGYQITFASLPNPKEDLSHVSSSRWSRQPPTSRNLSGPMDGSHVTHPVSPLSTANNATSAFIGWRRVWQSILLIGVILSMHFDTSTAHSRSRNSRDIVSFLYDYCPEYRTRAWAQDCTNWHEHIS